MIVSIYAAILALLYIYLSFRVVGARRKYGVSLGDNNEQAVTQAIRVHGNFAEYVPLALLLLFFAESGGWQAVWIHTLGIMLLLGRVLHAWGVGAAKPILNLRIAGTVLTLLVIIISAIMLLYLRFLSP